MVNPLIFAFVNSKSDPSPRSVPHLVLVENPEETGSSLQCP